MPYYSMRQIDIELKDRLTDFQFRELCRVRLAGTHYPK